MYTRGMGEPIVAMALPPQPAGSGAVDYSGGSWCGSGNPFVDFFCSDRDKASTVEQIITGTSDYGSQLSPESRAAAEAMARNVIAQDDPCNYSEINGMSWIDKIGCNLKGTGTGTNFVPVALLVGAVALVSIMRH